MSMQLFIGGMRGSRSCTGRAFEIYGGETTCLLVLGSEGERIILDAGTGLHAVAEQLVHTKPGAVTVLLSHYHLDHLTGLTMNPLFYRPGWSFTFVGPNLIDGGVHEAVTRLLNPPYWPVPPEHMEAQLAFSDLTAAPWLINSLQISACHVSHPGGCVAYRIDDRNQGGSLVFATDIEWRKQSEENKTAFAGLCQTPKSADLLIIDAHFSQKDLAAFSGWGHSCWEDGLGIATSMDIQRLLLGHHAPDADDLTLSAREQDIKRIMPGVAFARGGQWLTL